LGFTLGPERAAGAGEILKKGK